VMNRPVGRGTVTSLYPMRPGLPMLDDEKGSEAAGSGAGVCKKQTKKHTIRFAKWHIGNKKKTDIRWWVVHASLNVDCTPSQMLLA